MTTQVNKKTYFVLAITLNLNNIYLTSNSKLGKLE